MAHDREIRPGEPENEVPPGDADDGGTAARRWYSEVLLDRATRAMTRAAASGLAYEAGILAGEVRMMEVFRKAAETQFRRDLEIYGSKEDVHGDL